MQPERAVEKPEAAAGCVMTPEQIEAYLRWERERGANENALRSFRRFTGALYDWLPEDKQLTRPRLLSWRKSLEDRGYSPATVGNYVKGINRYLNCTGRQDLCFPRGSRKDITGQRFGLLTALEPIGEKARGDRLWRCRCDCGALAEFPAVRLLSGSTLSCGCLRAAHLQETNLYYEGTSLRMSMTERVRSSHAASGYTGVTQRGGKWRAYIRYKGRTYTLGTYTRLEDAVKARARGKELVRQDAAGLLEAYVLQHRQDPPRPDRSRFTEKRDDHAPSSRPERSEQTALRSDNSSGCPGVTRNRKSWIARITWQGTTYSLGSFPDREQAVEVRLKAQELLAADPGEFVNQHQKGKTKGS